MATAKTKADALGWYHSSPVGLGGVRADEELCPMAFEISNPIPPVVVLYVTPKCGPGTATIRAASATTLAFTAPGDTEGTPVTVTDSASILLESGTAGKSCRVYIDAVYSADDLTGTMTLELYRKFNNIIGGPNADETGGDYYSCFYIVNHSDADVSSISVSPSVLGTQRTSDSAQLSGSGAGTITTTGSLADWPSDGWCQVRNSGGTNKEIVYYSSRTSTSITVPAAGRGLLGTSATAGSGTDLIRPVSPIRLWAVTPTGGEVETMADNETEPTGASWSFLETIGTLAPGEERAIRIHRQVPTGCTINTEQVVSIFAPFTYSAVAYSEAIYGYFRIGDTTQAGYNLYIDDVLTEFSAALPIDTALAPDATYDYRVTAVNEYGLQSFNVLNKSIVIDSGGVDITSALTAPSNVVTASMPGGEVDITLTYRGSNDETIADYFRLYYTTDGSAPNISTSDYTDFAIGTGGFGLNDVTQTITVGPFAYGTEYKFIPRVYSSELVLESTNTGSYLETVITQYPVQAGWLSLTSPGYRGQYTSPYERTTTYGDASIEVRNGETILRGSLEAFRGVFGNGGEFRTTLDFANVTHSATGTSAAIEAVSDTEIYINVNGIRRAKIDLVAGTIECAQFENASRLSLPVIGPAVARSDATYLMVWNPITGKWRPFASVSLLNPDGLFRIYSDILQEAP